MSTITREMRNYSFRRASDANPYRINTKLYNLFELMKDGTPRTLPAITDSLDDVAIPRESPQHQVNRRRTASALRTIRRYLKQTASGNLVYGELRIIPGRHLMSGYRMYFHGKRDTVRGGILNQ
jgi:hypothetical protein